MPQNILDFILNGLAQTELGPLQSRPYDCAFDVLAAPPSQKKLIVMGFNGSKADKDFSNTEAITADAKRSDVCNVDLGVKGAWGSTRLAKQLAALPGRLGFDKHETVYTNSVLLCSDDAYSVKKAAKETALGSLEVLTERSMHFFAEVTMRLCEPELIVAYSNSLQDPSAASILYAAFGEGEEIDHVCQRTHTATFGFTASISGKRVPVVCIRHMSRYNMQPDLIRQAWNRQQVMQVRRDPASR